MHSSPSERIGSNFTPTAKHLSIRAIREERIRRIKLRAQQREDAMFNPKTRPPPPPPITPKSTYKPKQYVKFNKLVSRPPKTPRPSSLPGFRRKRVDLEAVAKEQQILQRQAEARLEARSFLESEESDDADSVIAIVKERRLASGQEAADLKLRSSLAGIPMLSKKEERRQRVKKIIEPSMTFMERYPYKPCQRGTQGYRKKSPHSLPQRKRQPLFVGLPSGEAGRVTPLGPEEPDDDDESLLKTVTKKVGEAEKDSEDEEEEAATPPPELSRAKRRPALILDEKTEREIRLVASRAALPVLASVKMKKTLTAKKVEEAEEAAAPPLPDGPPGGRIRSRRAALIPDKKTEEEMKLAASRVAGIVSLAGIKMKRKLVKAKDRQASLTR